ncbi:MAG: ABC transporter permease [Candidatus Zixiibacteriota bacterium]
MSKSNRMTRQTGLSRLLVNYGMLGILLLLCLFFSILTLRDQPLTGTKAALALFDELRETVPSNAGILIVSHNTEEDSLFFRLLLEKLTERGYASVRIISGDPPSIRSQLASLADSASGTKVMATTQSFAPIVETIKAQLKEFKETKVVVPPSRRWPTFLLPDNLRNVANQIAVIAIIAIGMTMVIITAGIDLSVGSLIALSAVVTAWSVGKLGGESASASAMLLASLSGMLLCGAIGAFSGLMITRFRIPPFIATLAMMQVAAGLAYVISQGKPIYRLPEAFIWLGRGAEPVLKIPYAVLLMAVLYLAAHVLMTRTTTGRYIYAVGGNMEAARLAGIRVRLVLFFVYAVCGMLAGLGGVVMASQLKSGAPTYGLTYELYVIAAVVVGGTSLSGGEGHIFGTLIGAFIISVIQNGMNLTNIESYTQKIILGLVILGAVLLDRLKQRGFRLKRA